MPPSTSSGRIGLTRTFLLVLLLTASAAPGTAEPRRLQAQVAAPAVPTSGAAQATASADPTARRTIDAARLNDGETIVLDGMPDEPAWRRAGVATDFMQRDPVTGAPATERTEVRVLFDRTRLLIGATLLDSEPDRLLGNQMQRDQPFGADDRFMWGIDTYLDGRTGYFFEINPSGAMGDGIVTGPGGGPFGGQMNKSWDGIWIARVRRTDRGWSAEIEIPFRTINFDPKATAWGINFQRTVRRKNEESLWSGWMRNEGLLRMSNAGRLTGVRDVSQGLGVDFKPYGLGGVGNAPGRGEPATTGDGNAGADVFYSLTPKLRANFTVNTDFAETEVDTRRTNLTRFPLFFPERRDFFLEGASFFDFPPQDSGPFFSRRIGLTQGSPQRIIFGTRLAGQIGRNDVGLLHVRTGQDDPAVGQTTDRPSEDFSVLRTRHRFGSQSFLGFLYTRRATRPLGGASDDTVPDDQHTMGVDLTLATPRFLGNRNFETGGFFVHTTGLPGTDAGRKAFGGRVQYNNEPLSIQLFARQFDAGYDAAVGFTPRRNFRRFNPQIEYTPRVNWKAIREFQFQANGELSTLVDGTLVNRMLMLTPLEVVLQSGDRFQFQLFPTEEQLEIDFEISPGIVLPKGSRYRWLRRQVIYQGANQRRVAARVEYSDGNFYDGTRREFNLDVFLRPRRGIYIQLASEYNDVDLRGGSFITRLYRLDARTQFSPWMSLTNNVQYDSQSGQVGWQMRFRWIRRPGNDTYVVYTENWKDDPLDNRFATLDRRGVVKVVQTWRF